MAEWEAFSTLEPFGYFANFQGHAMVASTIAEVNRNTKKKKDAYNTSDFMPQDPSKQVEKPSVFKRLKDYLLTKKGTEQTDVNSSNTSRQA